MTCNVVHERFLRQREEERHRRNLQTMRARLDTKVPKTASLKITKGKRLRLKVDREADIRHENNVLLKKMLTIDLKPSPLNPLQLYRKSGSLTSLNSGARVRDLYRINESNKVSNTQGLYTRLKSTNSVYSIERWEKANRRHEYLSHNLSRNSGHLDATNAHFLTRSNSSRPNTVSSGHRFRMSSTRGSARPRTEGGPQNFQGTL